MIEISAAELKTRLDRGERLHLLDVREDHELARERIDGAEHIALLDLLWGERSPSCAAQSELVIVCHVGIRSLEAARYLRANGYPRARSLAGGLAAFSSLPPACGPGRSGPEAPSA